ncbi:hypothetical protein ABZU75_03535 [Streptosporangium sp. NPDC005286]
MNSLASRPTRASHACFTFGSLNSPRRSNSCEAASMARSSGTRM